MQATTAGLAGLVSGPLLASAGARPRTVVCLFLRGGADGLTMVVPHTDSLYFAARPRTAVSPREVLDLDGRLGLHPALAPLWPWWRQGLLGVAPAVGLPDATGNHLREQTRLEHLVAGAALIPRDRPLGPSLTALARVIGSGSGPRFVRADLGGWDTHLDQGGTAGRLAGRLAELGKAMADFAAALGDRLEDVAVVTVTEFGRSLRENSHGGTDHGRAGAALILGGAVQGGRVLGPWPGLEGLITGARQDLTATLDLRTLLQSAA